MHRGIATLDHKLLRFKALYPGLHPTDWFPACTPQTGFPLAPRRPGSHLHPRDSIPAHTLQTSIVPASTPQPSFLFAPYKPASHLHPTDRFISRLHPKYQRRFPASTIHTDFPFGCHGTTASTLAHNRTNTSFPLACHKTRRASHLHIAGREFEAGM